MFGINNWIRSFSKKLAKQNVPVLALPLYGRTAPKLDLTYSQEDLKLGRHHKNLTTSKNIIQDVSAAITWVKDKYSKKKISIIGFCFYGAGVTTPRFDTNSAPIDLLEKVSGKLNFICGSSDDLIPLQDRLELKKDFKN
jgi:carboxymethylenebutenolidase